jgi:hypothetical protein
MQYENCNKVEVEATKICIGEVVLKTSDRVNQLGVSYLRAV